jgi:hypothetical protein
MRERFASNAEFIWRKTLSFGFCLGRMMMRRLLVLGFVLLVCICPVISGTAQPAMTQGQPSPSPSPSPSAGVCRNEDSGPTCPCDNPAYVRTAQGKCAPPPPCQPEEKAYDAAVAAQRKTQQELNAINSPAKERETMATNDLQKIAAWKAQVKKASQANQDAAHEVDQTYTKWQNCLKKTKS